MTNAKVVRLPEHTGNFSVFTNEAMQSEITGNAFKILMRSFNLSETWDYTVRGMCTLMQWGEKKVRNALRNLVTHGFASCHKQGRAGQGVTEGGEFLPDYYIFYESPSLNPYFQNSEMHEECDIFTGVPHGIPSRPCREAVQVNTKESTKDTVTKSVSPAPTFQEAVEKSVESLTDRLQPEIQNQLAEMTGYSFLKAGDFRDYVAETIPRIAEMCTNQPEVLEKILEINQAECSLIPFMNKLQKKCGEALKNLKHPQARENFIQSTIKNIILEYTTDQPEETKPAKYPETGCTTTFMETLDRMYPENDFSYYEEFRSEEELSALDEEDREIKKCRIPYDFQNDTDIMTDALK